ncbi:MAG: DUF2285 domain-containing protein [Proteobacteria bacterium]|nr:DUF2285 domain-containing protein [Pseudomonadota bacterium]
MSNPPAIADAAPDVDELTPYDISHLTTYLRLLDADNEGADWEEAASVVLSLDPAANETRAQRTWVSHLAQAKWMVSEGYRLLFTVDQELWEAHRPQRLSS